MPNFKPMFQVIIFGFWFGIFSIAGLLTGLISSVTGGPLALTIGFPVAAVIAGITFGTIRAARA